jgi:hypothetical protein
MEAVRTSETSVDNHFTRQYIPEDNSELSLIRLFSSLFSKSFIFMFFFNVSTHAVLCVIAPS